MKTYLKNKGWMALALGVICVCFGVNDAAAQPGSPGADEEGVQVLTRGPVHEAFAGTVTFDPEPGTLVPKTPPEAIEELAPDQRPEGDNVVWISGYWAWDDERDNFIWISGVWRNLPPGRQWVPGYWANTGRGSRWTSGYWADAKVSEVEYLPPPPVTVELGPNIAPPSPEYIWLPGCWVRHHGRYAWRPGYWERVEPQWVWVPAHYVCTPRGYIFVEGYWDHSIAHRGVMFAPVYFEEAVYRRPAYHYSPTIVININVFSDHLFVRPRYHHYYFGDYYEPRYRESGFYASFSFYSSHRGYDPIYAHRRWEHREDRDWDRRDRTEYERRRDNADARPPRTLVAQREISTSEVKSRDTALVVAVSLDQAVKSGEGSRKFQKVDKEERQSLGQKKQEVRKYRDERQKLETQAVEAPAKQSERTARPTRETQPAETPAAATEPAEKPSKDPERGARPSPKPGRVEQQPSKEAEPVKVKFRPSPIVGKPADQLGKGNAPPKAHKTPKADAKVEPKQRKGNVDGDDKDDDREKGKGNDDNDKGKGKPD